MCSGIPTVVQRCHRLQRRDISLGLLRPIIDKTKQSALTEKTIKRTWLKAVDPHIGRLMLPTNPVAKEIVFGKWESVRKPNP